MIIWFKCFCCSIKQKAEELLFNIYLEITLVEKLLETQLAENLNFYIRQVLYLKNPRTKKGLKVSVVWDTKSFKSTVVGIFKVVESRLFWSRFLVLLGHVRNLQVWRIWKNLTWDFVTGPNYRFIDRRKTKWKSAILPLRRVVYTCVCVYTYIYIWKNR